MKKFSRLCPTRGELACFEHIEVSNPAPCAMIVYLVSVADKGLTGAAKYKSEKNSFGNIFKGTPIKTACPNA
jgi:hypothetical protein